MCKVSEGRRRRKRKDLLMKPLQLWGLRVAVGSAIKETATTVASLGIRHMSVASLRRMMPLKHSTHRNLIAPYPPSPRTSPLVQLT